MIPQLESLLVEHFGGERRNYSFIKLHNGLAYSNPKVSFICFRGDNPVSFLKTVRHPTDAHVIETAFSCLHQATMWIRQSRTPLIIPEPLWITRVGDVPVSAESVAPGCALSYMDQQSIERIFNALNIWLSYGKDASHVPLNPRDLFDSWKDGLRLSHPQNQQRVEAIFLKVLEHAGNDIQLPAIPQHGDFTQSNILVDGDLLYLIDCDLFGRIQLPLFDVLTLVQHLEKKPSKVYTLYKTHILESLQILQLKPNSIPLLVCLTSIGTEWRKNLSYKKPISLESEKLFVSYLETAVKLAYSI
ncbi:phosphotransferase [Candidatus Uhrbacteria bacterium]|nr:phosphotransferase [Candidatus Uhrbacteria bacterium]